MINLQRAILFIILISTSVIFAGQIGPWSHFKAITSDYTVNLGDTLTISAGTEVRFSSNVKMNIYGVVKSNGTSIDPIIFGALSATDPTWGGIIISNADPLQVSTFNSTIFTKMYSLGDGPISISESSVDFINCRFLDNHATYNGGAVYVVAGNVNFTTCIFKNNNAENGGGLYIYNNPSVAPSIISMNYCSFLSNKAANGGGLYIEDYDGAMSDMSVSIQNTKFNYNKANDMGGFGGALFINILSHLDLKLKYCKIQYNDAFTSGGGIYAKFNEMFGLPVKHQEFANLLITHNSAMDGSGVYFNTGFTQNPTNIDFINTTIADNYILPGKTSKEYGGGGIHIVSNDNYPVIKNSIIWNNGNESYLDQFLISDNTFPNPSNIFSYCNINEYVEGQGNLSANPRFVRPPLFTGDITLLIADRYDYHLSLNSPCIDAGDPTTLIDPMATPEVIYPPVNMGTYGNTKQAAVPLASIIPTPAGTVSDLNIPDGGVVVLDFEGKASAFDFDVIALGAGSQLHFNGANLATINIKQLITPIQPAGKYFNDERIVIQKINDGLDLTTKTLNISQTAQLHGVELSDIQLTVFDPTGGSPTLNINNSKIYNSDAELLASGISAMDAASVDIINTTIDNFNTGIEIVSNNKNTKASGRITNNIITFDASASSKFGQQVGIQVQNTNGMLIDNNDIENGDIGIQISSSSSGRITNNTITFVASASSKDKLLGKIAINVLGGTDTVVEDNDIWITDTISAVVSGINIESSSAQIYYNKINFADAGAMIRNGIVFNNVMDLTYAYNNTIYNPTNGINNTSGFYGVDFVNNIIWNDGTSSAGVNNPDSLHFYNNNIEDLTGIVGVDNVSSDPMCIDPSTNDLVIDPTTSPCINTGLAVNGFHILDTNYFGTAPEIGAVEYYEIELSAPGNPIVSVTDTTFTFGWGSVTGASSYTVYSSNVPYAVFDSVATVVTTSWETPIATSKRFFYVIANDASKNVIVSNEPIHYEDISKNKKNTIIKKRILKKIRRTTNSNK
ncbi:MAG: right-handed parallel beta-helix repeat-containing protein [Candidatus Delongbacteria bacterium]|jgi:parallel beta-helix repeat protein|nr:right-handed parallel beta-helix repeat-containing protein [Candidatus Delongbacteria bacterium]